MDYKSFVMKKYPEALSEKVITGKRVFWIIKTNKKTNKYISEGENENVAWKNAFKDFLIN